MDTLLGYIILLPGAFLAPVLHEAVKARVSAALGDPTPKRNGFLSWNPFKYFEPIGFFLMLFFGVGWGQPAVTSPFYYKKKKAGIVLTYTIPMLVNLALGMAAIFLLNFVYVPWFFEGMIFGFGRLNIRLALFNLIPVFPMAMNKILHVFVSPETSMKLNHYEKPLQILLFFLLLFHIIERIIGPLSQIFIRAVTL